MNAPNSEPILEVSDLSVHYIDLKEGERKPAAASSQAQTHPGSPLRAVEQVSFSLAQGGSLGVVGESGCGKTTLMLALLRLLPEAGRIVQGQVHFKGRDLLQISEREMRQVRWREISLVFQGAMNALNPVRTIESQIAEALLLHNTLPDRRQTHQRVGELLELVGINARRARQYPHQYSGGMRQRAMIAMALACNPRILIADEPTTALDVMIQAQIIELLETLQKELGLTLIVVTHDLGLVAEMCQDVLVMYGGTTAEYASSDAIFNNPQHPYTQRLLQAFPDIENPSAQLASIPGVPPRLDELPAGCRFQPRCPVWQEAAGCLTNHPAALEIAPGHRVACHLVKSEKLLPTDSHRNHR